MRSYHFSLRLAMFLALTVVAIQVLAAQEVGQIGNDKDLRKAFTANDKLRRDLFAGEEQARKDDPQHQKVAQASADWYIYRITHKAYAYDPIKGTHPVHDDLKAGIADMVSLRFDKTARKNKVFIDLFGIALINSMNQVLARDVDKDPTTIVQASMMLPIMAKLKQEDIREYLIGMAGNSKTTDVVRLYSIKALREYMPITPLHENSDFFAADVVAKHHAEGKMVDALAKLIEQKVNVDGMSREQLGAVHYVRREAIVALAQAGAPAVLALKKAQVANKVKFEQRGLVAPTLLRVLAKNSLEPTPSLQEKIEASLGLCHMTYGNMSEYNPELTAYFTGKMLTEFVAEYNRDWANFNVVGPKKVLPFLPWKTDAKRLEKGLADLKAVGGGKAAAELEINARPILQSIMKYDQPSNIFQFNNFVPTLMPKSGAVFKTVKATDIPLP